MRFFRASRADVILIPEKPFDIEEICEYIRKRQKRGRNFSIIVAAEGAKPKGGGEIVYSSGVNEFGHARLGGVGKEIEKRFENIDTRAVVLGHLQRGGSPNAFDRVLATRFGIAAITLVNERQIRRDGCHQGKRHNLFALERCCW
jgi:6-phosphofructokinase